MTCAMTTRVITCALSAIALRALSFTVIGTTLSRPLNASNAGRQSIVRVSSALLLNIGNQ